jgi:hypothetical protein
MGYPTRIYFTETDKRLMWASRRGVNNDCNVAILIWFSSKPGSGPANYPCASINP